VTDGAAAAAHHGAKRAHYAQAGVAEAYDLVPLSVESFGCLGKPAMGLFNALADASAPLRYITELAQEEGFQLMPFTTPSSLSWRR
jgi:hypothetical protein